MRPGERGCGRYWGGLGGISELAAAQLAGVVAPTGIASAHTKAKADPFRKELKHILVCNVYYAL